MTKCEDHPLDVDVHEEGFSGQVRARALLLFIASACTLIACFLSCYLIYRHVTNYTQPKQQKLIIRILFMVPIYTIACVLSIAFYRSHVYIAAVYEFYESLVIASFFLLLCRYLHLDVHSLRNVFAVVEPKAWLHPVRFFRKWVWRKKTDHSVDGLKWFNLIWAAIFQFCVVKFLGALLKCITEALDVYCKESMSVSHARIWIQIIEVISLLTAMFCLLQFYHQAKLDLAPHRPLLKFVAIKLVIAIFYLQSFIFGLLTKEGGVMKPTRTISYPSLAIGIPNTVLCFEMALISVLHLWAYPYAAYQIKGYDVDGDCQHQGTSAIELTTTNTQSMVLNRVVWWRALLHALSFKDVLRGVVDGVRGLAGRHRTHATCQAIAVGAHGNVEHYKTTSLSEALEIAQHQNH